MYAHFGLLKIPLLFYSWIQMHSSSFLTTVLYNAVSLFVHQKVSFEVATSMTHHHPSHAIPLLLRLQLQDKKN
jgi:hypothetical protein